LLKLAQEPNHGENVLLDPKTKIVTMKKNILKTRSRYACKKVDF
jgi:hypothetical protein